MYIKKLFLRNFKCYEEFSLDLNGGINILVGDNEAGKSTILEAIHLALSGLIYGKYLKTELNQSLFNTKAVNEYLESLQRTDSTKKQPPEITIELFFEFENNNDALKALYEGNKNTNKQKASGIQFKISLDERYRDAYEGFLNSGDEIKSLPIEYYEFSWSSFARDDRLTPATIPFKSALIDSSNNRHQNGSDIYIAKIIRDLLTDEEKAKISLAHRRLKDSFATDESVQEINDKLPQGEVTNKKIHLSVDLSSNMAWESSLTTFLDNMPFSNIGRGEQCLVKTGLALRHKKAQEACVLMLEEPENHLSHSKLNKLIRFVKDNHTDKQIILSTHSSFVANKLGLDSLILLNIDEKTKKRKEIRITNLEKDTQEYFEKLSGYDTLRLILCKKAILVEGPSDELIVQKAYMAKNNGRLPIEDEIDVISVGTSFLRFLEIAEKINKHVAVVTDNDGDYDNKIGKKYEKYKDSTTVEIFADSNNELNTLEPQIVEANKFQLQVLRTILNIQEKAYPNEESIKSYMKNNKADRALQIFSSSEEINFPQYILDAINWAK